ncbi:serine--tRNA ligase [Blastopirellula marina]|uniref:Serine--tRNA ligase n=1 Tax=Blastopirellula marina DSM 3645 TaxID=314230 RepID=A3ZYE6_9BACT|nr:serine--tRNA ligase [Blastopirellula marina]EAQ78394.1 seryl-tRNA synthetase [Blastopirellula marina DSM 3645]
MLDRKFVLDNVDLVQENCRLRGVDADVAKVAALETARRQKQQETEDFNRRANETSKLIGKASAEERPQIIEEGRKLREEKDAAQKEVDRLDAEIVDLLRLIPNLTHPAAPIGADDQANLELRRGKTEPRKFDFKVLDHVELGENLDLIDFESGAQVAGAGFYFLKNEAVLLELALQRYVLEILMKEGFTPTITPDLARTEILHGVGFIPRGPETQIYSVENTDLNLVATAEITLGGMNAGKVLEAEDLPKLYCGMSHCYRTEAGSAGRASRGLYRVHQFTKVEMFAFTLPDQSDATLDKFCDLECQIFDGLGIPYRVVDTATGDLGGPAYRKFDLEAWMPGRGEAGEWGEVTSTSNCTDYQARRLNIRYRTKGEKGTQFAHTLNGTAIAISRGIIAVLENYQQADGSIEIPAVLRSFMGVDKIAAK